MCDVWHLHDVGLACEVDFVIISMLKMVKIYNTPECDWVIRSIIQHLEIDFFTVSNQVHVNGNSLNDTTKDHQGISFVKCIAREHIKFQVQIKFKVAVWSSLCRHEANAWPVQGIKYNTYHKNPKLYKWWSNTSGRFTGID